MRFARFLLAFMCGFFLIAGARLALASTSVPPDVGNYNYGFVRCDTWHNGYASRTEDEQVGANYYYNASGCGAQVTTPGAWATPTSPEGGACGGYPGPPGYFLGIETSNQTNDLVTYKYGTNCASSSQDGLSIKRVRSVSCPVGYTPNSQTNLCDPPAGINPTKNNNTCNAGCNGTDPINSATGALVVNESDYAESNGDLHFERTYTSAQGLFDATSLGTQWRDVYDRRITVITSGSTTEATAYRPNGDRYHFILTNGQWISDQDVALVLTMSNPSPGVYTNIVLTDTDGTQETYDTNGYLTQIIPLDQRILTLTYSGIYVSQVTDQHGRSLTFKYGQIAYQNQTQLTEVDTPDGLAIKYGYDSSTGNLTSVSYVGTVNGQSVTQTRSYVYGENGAPAYAMTGLVDEANQRYTSWAYDAQGRATLSVHGVSTDYPGRTELTYNTNGSTSITNWINGTTGTFTTRLFNFSVVQGVAHLSGVSCSGCSSPAINLPGIPTQPASTSYDSSGYPTSSADFNNNITATQYDDTHGMIVQEVDASGTPNQRTVNFTWDTTLRVLLKRIVLDVNNNTVADTQWVYNSLGESLARCQIDPTNSAATGYVCSNTGTVPAGVRRWTYTYCTTVGTGCPLVGLMLTATGPRTDLTQTTSYSYYTSSSASGCGTPGAACYQPGDLYQVTDALGHVTTIASYDGAGRITRIIDPNGVDTDITYTPRGWLATRTVGGAETIFGYTAYGAVQTITDPDGVTTTFGYDTAHRLTKITDALGNYIQYTLDAAGNKTAEQVYDSTGALHKSLSRTFNTLGQLTGVVDGLNHTVFSATYSDSYDANGNLVHSADALGIQQHLGYDALNRLTQTINDYNGTDGLTPNTTTGVAYDALDRTTGVTDPSSLNTSYQYDGLSDQTVLTSPDTGTANLSYDAAGNVSSRTDAKGVVTQYTYDALNRLTGVSYPAQPTLNITYTYDQVTPISGCPNNFNIGHLTTMTDASGTTSWCYTNQGDIREVRQVINSTVYLHGYAYTSARRLKYLQYPSGFELEYGFDADGRVNTIGYVQQPGPYGSYTDSTLTSLITGVTYQPFGPVAGYTYALNGQSVARTYDANYRLTDLVGTGLSLHFLLDAKGRIQAEGNAAGANPANETYLYDPLDHLRSLTNGSGTVEQSFTYNATGDRTSKTLAGQATETYTYNPGTHQLNSVGGVGRSVDANGNTTAMTDANGELIGLGYDDRNRLTVITSAGNTIANYQYNGEGQRVWRTITEPSAGQAATVYDPAGTGNLYGEYFATDYREYVYLGGIPVASATDAGKAAPGINYLYADQLGTLRAVVSTSGTTNYTWPWLNNAFGDQPTQGTGEFYTRFPGQYFDVETGLEYNGARYYDSSTGRFPQADPAGLRGGINSYVYGLNDPLTYIDPTGLAPPGAPPPIGPFSPDPGPATTVTVNYYSGGLGHAGVSVNGDTSLGFYGDEDQTTELAFAFGFSGPGFIDEDQGTPSQSVTFYVTPEDAFEARNKLKKLFKNPGQYNLYKRNCASVAEDVLKSANISNVPNTMFPNALIRDLRNSQ